MQVAKQRIVQIERVVNVKNGGNKMHKRIKKACVYPIDSLATLLAKEANTMSDSRCPRLECVWPVSVL